MTQAESAAAGPSTPAGGHLDYYRRHGISPVRYEVADLRAHFERRDGLYRGLGLPAIAFRGARVLEVAPGSGQNSLYLATQMPRELHLVEPNPTGRADIGRAYRDLAVPHTPPALHAVRLQEFEADDPYDVVICENWLGGLPEERALLGRLARMVAPGGVLVVTAVPSVGFFPNVMRKLLTLRLLGEGRRDFAAATEELVRAFSPHLATIAGMTRSHRDWVQDCMLNPHYLDVALSFRQLLEAVDDGMEVLGTSPRFITDWRWFKAMTGTARGYDAGLLQCWQEQAHNLLDYRVVRPARRSEDNAALISLCDEGLEAARRWQGADDGDGPAGRAEVTDILDRLQDPLAAVDQGLAEAFAELRGQWAAAKRPTAEQIAGLGRFAAVFGRETVYVSMTRRHVT